MPSLPWRTGSSTMVAVASLSMTLWACGGDDPAGPDQSVAFLVGDWAAVTLVMKNVANPEVAPELIEALGATFTVNVQPSGQYTAILGFGGQSFTEIGDLDVEGNEIVFNVTFPRKEVNRSTFTLSGDRLTLVGPTEFDFNLDGTPEEAEATIALDRQ